MPSRHSRCQGKGTRLIQLFLFRANIQSLIQRSYRDDVPPSYIERFLPLILDMEEDNIAVTPCFTDEGINYMHIRHNNLYRKLALAQEGKS